MPRTALEPTAEQRRLVKSFAAVGIKQADIARKLGIRSEKTLRKHFRAELDEGAVDANYTVAQSLFQSAKAGNVAAGIFWMKSRAGWSERPTHPPSAIALPPFVVAREQGAAA